MASRLAPLGLIVFVFNVAGGLIAPALPLYARRLGGDYRDLGVIGATHGLVFAALTIPLGRASDRFGRHGLLALSTLAEGLSAAGYCFAGQVRWLVLAKAVQAAGSAAFWPALEAWVAEEFGLHAGTAMGVAYGAYAAALLVGTSTAGFVIERVGLRAPFAVSIATSAATAGLLLLLRGRRPAETGGDPGRVARPEAPWPGDDPARRQRALAYGTGFVYVFGLGTVLAFLPAYAADRGLGPGAIGLLLGSYYVGRLLASLAAGRISDRRGRRAVLVPAVLLGAPAAIVLAASASPEWLFLGAVGLGLTAGACAPTCVGLIADHVRPPDRGLAMGLFEGACGLAFIVSGLAGGYAAEALGASAPYLLVAGLCLTWVVVLLRGLPSPGGRPPA